MSKSVKKVKFLRLVYYPWCYGLFNNTSRSVSPGGFEPPTTSLRGRCSTIELWALNSLQFYQIFSLNSRKSKFRGFSIIICRNSLKISKLEKADFKANI